MESRQTIGQLNGAWAIILKVALATYPIVVASIMAWGVWVTREQLHDHAFRSAGDRFTQHDGAQMRADLLRAINEHSQTPGHAGIIERIGTLEWNQRQVMAKQDTMIAAVARIEAMLELRENPKE